MNKLVVVATSFWLEKKTTTNQLYIPRPRVAECHRYSMCLRFVHNLSFQDHFPGHFNLDSSISRESYFFFNSICILNQLKYNFITEGKDC